MTCLADIDPDNPLTPLQAASRTYRIALGLRAGKKVLGLCTVPGPPQVRVKIETACPRCRARNGAWCGDCRLCGASLRGVLGVAGRTP